MPGSLASSLELGNSTGKTLAIRACATHPHGLLLAEACSSYDSSAHLAEETHDASDTVAKGMWAATLCAWVLSVPVCTTPTLFTTQVAVLT